MQRIVTKVCWRSWSTMCRIFVLRPFEGHGLNRHESCSEFSIHFGTCWVAQVLPRAFAASRPATITLFGCLPPQLADFDEESKARHRGLGQLKCVLSWIRRSGMILNEACCVGGTGTVLQRWQNKRALVFWTTIVTRAYGSLVPWHKMSPKALRCSIHSVLTWCDTVSWVSCEQRQGVDHFWDALSTIENAREKGEWKRSP